MAELWESFWWVTLTQRLIEGFAFTGIVLAKSSGARRRSCGNGRTGNNVESRFGAEVQAVVAHLEAAAPQH